MFDQFWEWINPLSPGEDPSDSWWQRMWQGAVTDLGIIFGPVLAFAGGAVSEGTGSVIGGMLKGFKAHWFAIGVAGVVAWWLLKPHSVSVREAATQYIVKK